MLKELNAKGGATSSQLEQELAETRAKLREAEAEIERLN